MPQMKHDQLDTGPIPARRPPGTASISTRRARLLNALSAIFAAVALVTVATPAGAAPRPRPDEWWFPAWGLQRDIWPLTEGSGVTVAVLDTGVNARLPELSGTVLKGGDTTGEETDGRRDLDDDGGGHGTGMAALIAGQGGGRTGFVGIAPEAKILPVHVTSKFDDTYGPLEAIAAGIRFAVDHHASIISISLAINSATIPGHCDPGIQAAIGYAINHDVVVVAGAGNNGNTTNWPMMPASCAGVVAVGAIDQSLRPWKGTQRQPYVTIAAPGAGSGLISGDGRYFPQAWGTSIATALTSGAIALIRSRHPAMPGRTVVQRLIVTAHHAGPARNDQTGYGPIQITSALDTQHYPVAPDAPNPTYTAIDAWRASRYGTTPPSSPPRTPAHHHATTNHTTRSGILIAAGVAAIIVTLHLLIRRYRRGAASPPG